MRFPGWTAVEIHAALNEETFSAETSAVLERVGTVLGEREGTGPDDDPLLGAQRRRSRARGHAEGHAKGRAEGRAEGRREGELRGKVVTIEGLPGPSGALVHHRSRHRHRRARLPPSPARTRRRRPRSQTQLTVAPLRAACARAAPPRSEIPARRARGRGPEACVPLPLLGKLLGKDVLVAG